VKASPVAGPRGFDGAKKVDGVKRHVLLDSAGVLVAAVVTPADVQDRAASPTLLRKGKRIAPTISHVWVDNGYTGQTLTTAAAAAGVTVDVVSGAKACHGFIVQPRRWVVERTNSWINHCRRLDRHYEITPTHTKVSSTSAKSPYYPNDSTAASCSTRFRSDHFELEALLSVLYSHPRPRPEAA
jgi:transposase